MEESKYCNLGDVCNTISETYRANSSKVVLINTSDVLEGACLNHEKVENKDLKGQFKKVFHQNDILYSEIRPANKRFAFMEELKEYRLEEIGTIVGGATPSTKEQSYYDGNISWITPKDLSNYTDRFISRGKRMISQNGFDSCSCKMLPKGSILFSSRAPIGYIAIAENELCTNQGFKSIIPNNRIVDNMFLFYLLEYNKHAIEGMGSGTTFKEVSGDVMKKFKVRIPCLQKQKQIASVLSIIDEKIELNRRINDNLEKQAQGLYKSWFIDFEPFKGGKFVDSELGEIPEGWRVGRLSDVGRIVGGSTPSKSHSEYYTTNGIPWLTPKDLSMTQAKFTSRGEIDITEIGYKSCSTKLLPRGSVIFSSRAPIGYISIALNEICTNQGFKSIVPNREIGTAFIFYYLKANTSKIESRASGSTFKEASGTLINSLSIIRPPLKVIHNFNEIMTPIFFQQEKNEGENEKLSKLRDTLLPKLMSGELKISDLNS